MNPPPAFPISPEQFWTIFSESLRAEWANPALRLHTAFNGNAAWTHYITGFLTRLAVRFSCIPETEFWPRIDIGYVDKAGAEWDQWALEVAIEHENDLNWNDKLSRLLMLNAGLKVLIAYSDNRERIAGMLHRFVEIHRSRKYLPSPSAWLFIFGPRSFPSTHDFIAFKFDGTSFAEITDAKKILS
jgi:hypothetical protein